MGNVAGFFAPALVYLFIFVLQIALPGRWVQGYVTKTGSAEKLRYRLNGLPVLLVVVFSWAFCCWSGYVAWDWFYVYRWYALAGAIVFGLVFSLALVLPYPAVKRAFLADFYLGRLENPQLWGGRVDAKMWLYLVGATLLEINVLSFTAHHLIVFGMQGSSGILLASALLTFFVVDYLSFEEVHLYTYDLFAERVGFKLGWGCTAFYPFFYAIPIWATADIADSNTPAFPMVLHALVFFAGWCLSRGANLQKYFFKKDPTRVFLGIRPETISNGDKSLLVNGFWGLSRHINYLGEILMASGIVLCTGHPTLWQPWLYPLYYVALLFPRQRDDDKRCALKYGALWEQYMKKVPYKIIPYLY